MKKTTPVYLIVLLSLLAGLLLTAAAPMQSGQSAADFVRLTINNKNPKSITIFLTGPFNYTLTVDGEESAVFIVQRGEYDYRLRSCGFTSKKETLDLTSRKTLVMPICGGNAGRGAKGTEKVDLSKKAQVVKVEFTNDTGTRLTTILTGPGAYVFNFDKEEELSPTIAKGIYTIQYFACGKIGTRTFQAYKDAHWEFTCPK